MRGLYGALAAMVLAIIIGGAAVLHTDWQTQKAREQSRDDVVVFACLAIRYSDEADIRSAFLAALSELGHHCPTR